MVIMDTSDNLLTQEEIINQLASMLSMLRFQFSVFRFQIFTESNVNTFCKP